MKIIISCSPSSNQIQVTMVKMLEALLKQSNKLNFLACSDWEIKLNRERRDSKGLFVHVQMFCNIVIYPPPSPPQPIRPPRAGSLGGKH